MKKYGYLAFITIASFLSRFFYLGKPREIVWDEVHFGNFILNYFFHNNYFDIHPPLGKLVFLGFAKIFGFYFVDGADATAILSDPRNLFILRLVPAIFGSLLVPLMYFFVRFLTRSERAAKIASFCVLIESAFIVYSRFILTDILLIFFGILAFTFFLWALREKAAWRYVLLVFSGISMGISIGIKWTALAIWLIIFVYFIWKICQRFFKWREVFYTAAIFLFVPIIVYIASFGAHFALANKLGKNAEFYSHSFLKTLDNNTETSDVVPLNFIEKFAELNSIMLVSNWKLDKPHPYQSAWYDWPFAFKAVYFWDGKVNVSGQENKAQNIFFFGNLVTWIIGFMAVIVSLLVVIFKRFYKKVGFNPGLLCFLIFAYLVNWLPFAFIKRPLFLYHYFFALVFAIVLFGTVSDKIISLWPKSRFIIYSILGVALIFTLFFLPLIYGLPEPAKLYEIQKFILY